jgi:hypothetical protein
VAPYNSGEFLARTRPETQDRVTSRDQVAPQAKKGPPGSGSTFNPTLKHRPSPIGVSTGHPNITAGTIGCRVVKDGKVYALSNNHVYADENNAHVGDNVLQPGPYDGGQNPADAIGTLEDFEPIVFSTSATNVMDAAIALSSVGDLLNHSPVDGGYGTPATATVAAAVGLEVQKYGRTTKLTSAKVSGINATVDVGYSTGTARFVNQIIVGGRGFSKGGDSGSLIVTKAANNPVGLLFAGSQTTTIGNPIDPVLSRFDVQVDDR